MAKLERGGGCCRVPLCLLAGELPGTLDNLSGATGIWLRTGRLKYLENHSGKMATLTINCDPYYFLICSLFYYAFINSFEWLDNRVTMNWKGRGRRRCKIISRYSPRDTGIIKIHQISRCLSRDSNPTPPVQEVYRLSQLNEFSDFCNHKISSVTCSGWGSGRIEDTEGGRCVEFIIIMQAFKKEAPKSAEN
jgi:hypothetical protein